MACVFHLKETRDIGSGSPPRLFKEQLLSSPTLFSLSYGALTLGCPPDGAAPPPPAPSTPTLRPRP